MATPNHTNGEPTYLVSYYGIGDGFHGKTTANCEKFDAHKYTVAVHPWMITQKILTYGTILLLTNPKNGKRARVRVTDTGSFQKYGRMLDISAQTAKWLGMYTDGVAPLEVRVVYRPDKSTFGKECAKAKKQKGKENA